MLVNFYGLLEFLHPLAMVLWCTLGDCTVILQQHIRYFPSGPLSYVSVGLGRGPQVQAWRLSSFSHTLTYGG